MILSANALHIPLKDESVHCIVTSPRDDKGRFVKGFHYHPSTQFKKGEHWRPHREHWDREWLFQKYSVEEESTIEIAGIVGCTENNILYWLNKHKIPTRNMSEIRNIKYWGCSGETNPMYGKRGSNHPNWQGGLTPFRQQLYATVEAKKWFRAIYARDGRRCKVCLSDKDLDVHHILPFRKYPLLVFDKNNGIVLCGQCHNKMKRNEMRYAKKLLRLIQGGTQQ